MAVLSLLVFLPVLLTGCAGSSSANAATPAPAKVAASSTSRAPNPATPVPKSAFTIDGASRDPFFPQQKKAAALALASAAASAAASAPVQSPTDLRAQLAEGLQGIGGTSDQRIAVINNVILEPGRSTEISLSQNRIIKVRCREITRDSVMLDVEGYGPVVVSPKQML